MPEWLIIMLIICGGIWIAWTYTKMWLDNQALKEELGDTTEFTQFTPTRYIMLSAQGSMYMTELMTTAMRAHSDGEAHIKNYEVENDSNLIKIKYENGNEIIWLNCDKAPIDTIKLSHRDDYAYKLFVDHKLPEGTARALIEYLGLVDYMVSLGICSKSSGGK